MRKELQQKLPKDIANLLMHGCETVAFLQEQTDDNENPKVFTSRLSKVEMLFGILDGQAHARLAREGISYRMRQRLSAQTQLVWRNLDKQDYEELSREADALFETLQQAGIDVDFAEDQDQRPIARFSELLQSNVFLDVLDCWMYGCAVAIQADQIITFDNNFRTVVNQIHNPSGQDDWQRVHDGIIQEWASQFPVPTAVTFSLPQVQDLPKRAPQPWDGDRA